MKLWTTQHNNAVVLAERDTWMRIIIADDQPAVRYALRVLLGRQPGMEVVGEAISVQELFDLIQGTFPDILLLDWELPGLDSECVLQHIKRINPELSVIALSGRIEARQAAQLAGVAAFVSKGQPPEHLLDAIQQIL